MNLFEEHDVMGDYSPDTGYQATKWEHIKQSVERGEMKASRAYVELRSIKSEIDDILKDVEREVVGELTQLNDKEELIVLGYKISHVKGRVTYNYKQSEVWNEKKNALKEVEEKLKQATKMKAEIVDKETGEIFEPVEVKHGAAYLKMEKA